MSKTISGYSVDTFKFRGPYAGKSYGGLSGELSREDAIKIGMRVCAPSVYARLRKHYTVEGRGASTYGFTISSGCEDYAYICLRHGRPVMYMADTDYAYDLDANGGRHNKRLIRRGEMDDL